MLLRFGIFASAAMSTRQGYGSENLTPLFTSIGQLSERENKKGLGEFKLLTWRRVMDLWRFRG